MAGLPQGTQEILNGTFDPLAPGPKGPPTIAPDEAQRLSGIFKQGYETPEDSAFVKGLSARGIDLRNPPAPTVPPQRPGLLARARSALTPDQNTDVAGGVTAAGRGLAKGAGGVLGAEAGGAAGLALGVPLAPFTMGLSEPVLGTVGAVAGYMGGAKIFTGLLNSLAGAAGVEKESAAAEAEHPVIEKATELATLGPLAAKGAAELYNVGVKAYGETGVAAGLKAGKAALDAGATGEEAAAAATGAAQTAGKVGAAKAVGQTLAARALGGAAAEPVRYGLEAGAQRAGLTREPPEPITAGSVGQMAGIGMLMPGGARHEGPAADAHADFEDFSGGLLRASLSDMNAAQAKAAAAGAPRTAPAALPEYAEFRDIQPPAALPAPKPAEARTFAAAPSGEIARADLPTPQLEGERAAARQAQEAIGLTPDVIAAQQRAAARPAGAEPAPKPASTDLVLQKQPDGSWLLPATREQGKAVGLKGFPYKATAGGFVIPASKQPDVQALLNEARKQSAEPATRQSVMAYPHKDLATMRAATGLSPQDATILGAGNLQRAYDQLAPADKQVVDLQAKAIAIDPAAVHKLPDSLTPEQAASKLIEIINAKRPAPEQDHRPAGPEAIRLPAQAGPGNADVTQAAARPGAAGEAAAVTGGGGRQPAGGEETGPALKSGWEAFPPESGTIGIPRSEMPQIKAEHRGALVNFLNARGIEHESVEVPADELKPTQAEFSPEKVEKAKKFDGGDRSILISSDNYVVDGHHQWLAKKESGEPIKAVRLKAPIADLLPKVKEFPSAETSTKSGESQPVVAAPRPVQPRAPADLQPRSRERAASVMQMQRIAAAPDPDLLSASRTPLSGAPMVSAQDDATGIPEADMGRQDVATFEDGRKVPFRYAVVEAHRVQASNDVGGKLNPKYGEPGQLNALNNGRTAGLQEAYRQGTAENYRKGIEAQAAEHGVPAEAIRGKQQPMLVRVYPHSHNTADIGTASNEAANLQLSASEQARTDAGRIDVNGMGEAGVDNKFLSDFVQSVPPSERGSLLTSDGRPTKQLMDRARAAVFMKAYGDERLLTAMAEETDPEHRNVMSAMLEAAPDMAQIGEDRSGVRRATVDAADMLAEAKRKSMTFEQYEGQQNLFRQNDDAKSIARFFTENGRSARRMGQGLKELAKTAAAEEHAASTADIFGNRPERNFAQIVEATDAALRQEHGQEAPQILPRTAAGGDGGPTPRGGAGGQPPSGGRTTPRESTAERGRPLLESYTEADLKRRADQEREAARQRAIDEQRAATDKQRGDFALTGSERPADVAAAAGQKSLFSRPAEKPSQGIAMSSVQTAVDRVMAKVNNGPRNMMWNNPEQLPQELRERLNPGKDTEAAYDPQANTVHYFADRISTPARATWVAVHEIVGHRGLRGAFGGKLDSALTEASGNSTVRNLADAILQDRGWDATPEKRLDAIEEAMAELGAADQTGNYDEIKDRYGVPVNDLLKPGIKAVIARFIAAIKRMFNALLGKANAAGFTDENVRDMLGKARDFLRGDKESPGAPEGEPVMASQRELPEGVTIHRTPEDQHGFKYQVSVNDEPVASARTPEHASAIANADHSYSSGHAGERVLKAAAGTEARLGQDVGRGRLLEVRSVEAAQALRQRHERRGLCYPLAARAAIRNGGDFIIGASDSELGGTRIWHAVTRLKDGSIYDPTYTRPFAKGIYEKAFSFEPVVKMTGDQVSRFVSRTGRGFPDPENLGLSLEPTQTPADAGVSASGPRDEPMSSERRREEETKTAAGFFSGDNPEALKEIGRGDIVGALGKYNRMLGGFQEHLRDISKQFDNEIRKNVAHVRAMNSAWERGLPVADKKFADFYRQAQQIGNSLIERLRAAGREMGYIENYLPHLYKDPKAFSNFAAQYLSKRPLRPGGFTKERFYDTLEAARKAGLEPISDNPVDLFLAHWSQMGKAVVWSELRNDWERRGFIMDDPGRYRAPTGWGKVNDAMFQGKLVPEQIARDLNTVLSPGMYQVWGWGAFRNFENMMLSANLNWSAFHGSYTTIDNVANFATMGVGYLARGDLGKSLEMIGRGMAAPLGALAGLAGKGEGSNLIKQYFGLTKADPNTAAVLNALMKGGARVYMSPTDFNDDMAAFGKAVRQGDVVKALAKGVPAAMEAMAYPIMRNLVPAQKMIAKVHLMKFELDRYAEKLGQKPGQYAGTAEAMNPDVLVQIARKVNQDVDARLGQHNYDNLFINRFARDWAQAAVTSFGWVYGYLDFLFGGLRDIDRLRRPEQMVGSLDREGKVNATMPRFTNRLGFMLTLAGIAAAINGGLTYALTGEAPEGKDFIAYRTGRKNTDGSNERMTIPTMAKEVYHWGHAPIEAGIGKIHPAIAFVTNMIGAMGAMLGEDSKLNRDWRGNYIVNPQDDLATQIHQAANDFAQRWLPISVKTFEQNQALGKDAASQVAPFFGFVQAPRSMTSSDFTDFLMHQHYASRGAMTPEQVQASHRYAAAVNATKQGQPVDLSQFSPRQRLSIREAARGSMQESFFKELPLADKLSAWDKASDEERQKFSLQRHFTPASVETAKAGLAPDQKLELQARVNAIRGWKPPLTGGGAYAAQ